MGKVRNAVTALALTMALAAGIRIPAGAADQGGKLKQAVESVTGQTTLYLDEYVNNPEQGGTIKLSEPIRVSGDVTLAIRPGLRYDGKLGQDPYLELVAKDMGRAFRVLDGGALTITGQVSLQGGGVAVDQGGAFTLEKGARITETAGIPEGGAVYNAGTAVIDSGILTYASKVDRGAFVYNEGDLTIRGESHLYHGYAGSGGMVYNTGTLRLEDGILEHGHAEETGGVIHNAGSFTMTGGAFLRGDAGQGGGVYNADGAAFEMAGGVMGGIGAPWRGSVVQDGGATSPDDSYLLAEEGGAVYNTGSFTMAGGIIAYARAGQAGGAVANHGTFTMTGGKIGGTDSHPGTQWYDPAYSLAAYREQLASGKLLSHLSAPMGGAVYNDAHMVINGGAIEGATADQGGGVYTAGAVEMTGGSIGYNTAEKGGGLYIADGGTVTVSQGAVTHNEAVTGGGIFTTDYAALAMAAAAVLTDNTADGLYQLTDPALQALHDRQIKIPHFTFSHWMEYAYNNYDVNHTDGTGHYEWFTVTYDPNGGLLGGSGALQHRTVWPEAAAPRPEDPVHPRGYEFRHWIDRSTGLPWDFGAPVDRDLYLRADWRRPTDPGAGNVFVSFDPNGGTLYDSPRPYVLSLTPGGAVDAVSDPVHPEGRVFRGWLHVKNDNPFSFGTPIREDTWLYAAWEELDDVPDDESYLVRFDPHGGQLYGTDMPHVQTVAAGAPATRPADPVRTGHAFLGWLDSDTGVAWDFATAVTQHLYLHADWESLPVIQKPDYSLVLGAGSHRVEVLDRRNPNAMGPALEEILPHLRPAVWNNRADQEVTAGIAYRSADYSGVNYRTLGSYPFTLTAEWDDERAQAAATVQVVDTTPPEITTARASAAFNPGHGPSSMKALLAIIQPVAEDNYDETVPFTAEIEGLAWQDVDWSSEGAYTLLLNAADASGNRARTKAVDLYVDGTQQVEDTRTPAKNRPETVLEYEQEEDGSWITRNPHTGDLRKRGAALSALLLSAATMAIVVRKKKIALMKGDMDFPDEATEE